MKFKSLLAAALVAVSAFAPQAQAAAVSVTAGETAVFNFDVGAAGFSGAIDHVFFFTSGDPTTDATGYWEFFQDLDGLGALVRRLDELNFKLGAGTKFNDGTLSAVVHVLQGSSLFEPSLQVFFTDGSVERISSTQDNKLPEPASLALLGVGLLGAVVARRRAGVR